MEKGFFNPGGDHETFKPGAECNPVLPLNAIHHRRSFYRITLLEKTLDVFEYLDGEDDGPLFDDWRRRFGHLKDARLGLPLGVIFPHLQREFGVQRLQQEGHEPFQVDRSDVFLPSGSRRGPGRQPIPLDVPVDSLRGDEVKLANGLTISNPEHVARTLRKKGFVVYKSGDDVYLLRAAAPARAKRVNLPTPRTFSFHGVPNLDPAGMNDRRYFEILGDLLADPRAGTSGAGMDSPDFDSSALSKDNFDLLLAAYRDDPRFPEYAIRSSASQTSRLPAYEIGLISTYEQDWALLGYSRGELLSSITLAPSEEVTIEIFSWDKHKIENERGFSQEFESNREISSLAKVSSKVVRDLAETSDAKGEIGLGIPLPIEGVPVKLDVGGSIDHKIKEGIQNTVDQISEKTVKVSDRQKSISQVKVVQTHEFGEENRTIRKLSNPNAARTLMYNHFEILESYRVKTRLDKTKRLCLLVDTPDLGTVDTAYVLAYEDKLQRALLSPSYTGGFEAAKKLVAQGWFEQETAVKTEMEHGGGSSALTQEQDSSPTPPLKTVAVNLNRALTELREADLFRAAGVLAGHYGGEAVSDEARTRAEDALGLFNFWFKFKLISPGLESKAIAFDKVMSKTPAPTLDEIFEALSLFLAGMDDDWLTGLKLIAVNAVAFQLSTMLLLPPFLVLAPLFLQLAVIENNNGVPALINKAKKEVRDYEMTVKGTVATGSTNAADEDTVDSQATPTVFGLQELAMAEAEFKKLRLHIEKNKIYYENEIWRHEDANARFERLRLCGLHKFVENDVLGFVGNRSVFPLRLETLDTDARRVIDNLLLSFDPHGTDEFDGVVVPPVEDREEMISLPTAGVYMDSVLGKCDALEDYLLRHREMDEREKEAEVRLKEEQAKQATHETRRLALELEEPAPVVGDPS